MMPLALLPEGWTRALSPVAPFGGLAAGFVDAVLAFLILKAMGIFHSEVAKVDTLVAEYVRCRDYLLSTHRPVAGSGWHTPDGGPFREAWGNFNSQLEAIRRRYVAALRRFRGAFLAGLVVLLIFCGLWALSAPEGGRLAIGLAAAGAAGTGGLLVSTGWTMLRRQQRLMSHRTTGNYLIAPWPTDGGGTDRQFAVMEKFLPVQSLRAEADSAEVL